MAQSDDDLRDAMNTMFGGPQGGDTTTATPPASTTAPVVQDAPVVTPSNASQTGNVVNPFEVVPQLSSDVATGTARAKSADDMLTNFIAATKANQTTKEGALSTLVAAKTAVNDSATQETQDFGAATAPLFQRRVALANRAAEVAAMNPLKRAIVSTFSLAHNPEWLAQQDAAAQGQLQAQGQNYQNLMGIHDTTLKLLTDNYNSQTALGDLKEQDADQNVQLAFKSAGSMQQVVGSELAGLQADQEVTKTQALQRQDLLGTMTHDQINKALAQSQTSGGTATVNGIPLQTGELVQAQQSRQEVELNLAARGLAVQSQRLDLANAYEARAIAHMSSPQIQQAIANGGKLPDGTQLNSEALAHAYVATQQQNAVAAEAAAQSGMAPVYASRLNSIGTNATQGTMRAANLFGQAPPELLQQSQDIAGRIKAIGLGYAKAQQMGAGDQFVTSQLPALQGMQTEQQALMEKLANRWGDGDPNTTALARGWLTGETPNPAVAAAAYVTMIRTGTPAGTKLSPNAAAIIAKVTPIVKAFDAGGAGTPGSMLPGMPTRRLPKGVIDPALISQVSKAIQGQYNTDTLNSTITSAPVTAKSIVGVDGQPHSFSRVNPQDVSNALSYGDQAGLKATAQQLGMTQQQAQMLFDGGESGKGYLGYAQAKGKSAIPFSQLAGAYKASQQVAFLQALDHSPSATPGFKPSSAFVDLMNNPQFQQQSIQAAQGQANQSVGDYAISAVAGTGFQQKIFGYGRQAANTNAALSNQQLNQTITSAAKLRNISPVDSAMLTLHSIPGVSQPDADSLMSAVLPLARQLTTNGMSPGDAIDNVITKQKFQDPSLDKIRQTAARDWASRRPDIYKGLAGMLKTGIGANMNSGVNNLITGDPFNPLNSVDAHNAGLVPGGN